MDNRGMNLRFAIEESQTGSGINTVLVSRGLNKMTAQPDGQEIESLINRLFEREYLKSCDDEETEGDRTVALVANNPVKTPLIQNGPMCGMVALAMAAECMRHTNLDPSHILERAKSEQFTLQGEMYSVKNLETLVQKMIGCKTDLLEENITKHRMDICLNLLQGNLLLIPYDKDGNNEPCLKKGHKAHWALITGFCIITKEINVTKSAVSLAGKTHLYHLLSTAGTNELESLLSSCMNLYALARHGKSKHLAIWEFGSLASSNSNLVEFGDKDQNLFILPIDGVRGGLCNQSLILKR